MENDFKTIHDFQFELICQYFSSLERQGPGSPEMTRKALDYIDVSGPESRIADLGCGTGGQTMTLAESLAGRITGVDIFPDFIDTFNRNAAARGYGDRVRGVVGSMDRPPFGDGELDLIWSEGAIYNIGFARGLALWRRYLKPGGWVAVTEATWLTDSRPEEITRFWNDAYPEIDTEAVNLEKMSRAGYRIVASFTLPAQCWNDFYKSQQHAREIFLNRYPDNSTVREFIESQGYEEQLYHRYGEHYGYVFYIGRKP